jgi:hypothetical protein
MGSKGSRSVSDRITYRAIKEKERQGKNGPRNNTGVMSTLGLKNTGSSVVLGRSLTLTDRSWRLEADSDDARGRTTQWVEAGKHSVSSIQGEGDETKEGRTGSRCPLRL